MDIAEEKTKIKVPNVPIATEARRTESVGIFFGTNPATMAPNVYPNPTKANELLATSLDTLKTEVIYRGWYVKIDT